MADNGEDVVLKSKTPGSFRITPADRTGKELRVEGAGEKK
jgi:hypothetical protein